MRVENEAARMRRAGVATWGAWLPEGDDVFAPTLGGRLRGLPAWPTREAFRAIETPSGLLVATEGLSDPFESGETVEGLEGTTGFGLELWCETDERGRSVPSSIAFAVVSAMSYQVANLAPNRLQIDRLGVLSMELYVDDLGAGVPARFISSEGTVGVLLGVQAPGRIDRVAMPTGDVRYVGMRLLELSDLATIRTQGKVGREAVFARLGTEPLGYVSRVV